MTTIERTAYEQSRNTQPTPKLCPACRMPLRAHPYGLDLETCPTPGCIRHGFWRRVREQR